MFVFTLLQVWVFISFTAVLSCAELHSLMQLYHENQRLMIIINLLTFDYINFPRCHIESRSWLLIECLFVFWKLRFVFYWSWTLETLGELADRFWKFGLFKPICRVIPIHLWVRGGSGPDHVFITSLVSMIVQTDLHRVFPRLIEVLASGVMTLHASQGLILLLFSDRMVISRPWSSPSIKLHFITGLALLPWNRT